MDSCRCNSNPQQPNVKKKSKKNSSSSYLKNKAVAYVCGKTKKNQLPNKNETKKHRNFNAFECNANGIQTPFLKYAELAQHLGAWQAVHTRCPFCACRSCCGCERDEYSPCVEREARRLSEVRAFDARVRTHPLPMKIMYDIN